MIIKFEDNLEKLLDVKYYSNKISAHCPFCKSLLIEINYSTLTCHKCRGVVVHIDYQCEIDNCIFINFRSNNMFLYIYNKEILIYFFDSKFNYKFTFFNLDFSSKEACILQIKAMILFS